MKHENKHEFLIILGSIDCILWVCALCPNTCRGQYTRDHKEPTIILEAIASHGLWV